MNALARWDWLKFRAAHAPRGTKRQRERELRDHTTALLRRAPRRKRRG